MKLRTRFGVLLAGFIVGLMAVVSLSAQGVFLHRTLRLEESLVMRAAQRGKQYLSNEAADLGPLARQWARRADVQEFLEGRSADFQQSGALEASLREERLNFIGLFDARRQSLFAMAYVPEGGMPMPMPTTLGASITNAEALFRPAAAKAKPGGGGLLVCGEAVWLAAAAPLAPGSGGLSPTGTVVIARVLGPTDMRRLAAMSDESVQVYPDGRGRKTLGPDLGVVALNPRIMVGTAWLTDVNGARDIRLDVFMARHLFQQGVLGLVYLSLWILVCGIVIALFTIWYMDRWVLHDLSRSLRALQAGVQSITANVDAPTALTKRREDEMGALAEAINAMVAALSRSRDSLRASEEKYRGLVEAAPDGIASLTAEGRIVSGNTRFSERIVGVSEEVLRGQVLTDAWPGPLAATIHDRVGSLAPGEVAWLPDTPARTPDGERWFAVNLTRVAMGGDEPDRVLAVLRDTTERVVGQRAAQQRNKDLIQAQRLASMGILVSGVAHEVNNPNTVISLNVSILERLIHRLAGEGSGGAGGPRTAARDEALTILAEIKAASGRIAALVASLRSFARPSRGDIREPVAINEVLRAAADWLRHQLSRQHCRLTLDLVETLPACRGHAQQLLQMFLNIIQNACHALERPEAAITVTSRYETAGREIVVTVQDEGRGIPPANLEHIFDPFFTTRRDEGSPGLGLSVSAVIAEAHGGTIRVASTPGAGTCVTVRLPVDKESPYA